MAEQKNKSQADKAAATKKGKKKEKATVASDDFDDIIRMFKDRKK